MQVFLYDLLVKSTDKWFISLLRKQTKPLNH